MTQSSFNGYQFGIEKYLNQLQNNPYINELKEELNQKLQEFASYTDNLEEIFENREQIEISKFYERLPKPSLIAFEELKEGEIYHRNPARENKQRI